MPTAKMLADSTQSDAALERKKKKERHDRQKKSKKEDKPHHHSKRKTKSTFASGSNRKNKKKHKSTTSDKDTETKEGSEDSDLNLSKPLYPISHYINERSEMLEQMFHCIQGATLKKALPEILQDLPMKELKQLCLTQLEVMSKKRILRILAGDDPITISSSGTDESGDEGGNHTGNVSKRSTVAAQPADSTSSSIDRVEFQPVADSRVLADVSKTSSVVCKPTAEVELISCHLAQLEESIL
ncbi:caspase activity and apoptosis inhibitor 1 isoform X2 [Octopus bimaculoides]|uniref:caspase activity and apoptosis inhibitor 1 isoform X2 n=1 Tax=Octopus bimaculoides TaxID=37653 RepID=UPI0022E266E7|nr:caspase activity and apoptosis inhibitor 1 isoform X2 [Octopus bimaculoides]